jgi:hypothetical protein
MRLTYILASLAAASAAAEVTAVLNPWAKSFTKLTVLGSKLRITTLANSCPEKETVIPREVPGPGSNMTRIPALKARCMPVTFAQGASTWNYMVAYGNTATYSGNCKFGAGGFLSGNAWCTMVTARMTSPAVYVDVFTALKLASDIETVELVYPNSFSVGKFSTDLSHGPSQYQLTTAHIAPKTANFQPTGYYNHTLSSKTGSTATSSRSLPEQLYMEIRK